MTTQKTTRGGYRENSGRKPLAENLKKKSAVIRVDVELIPLIEKLKTGAVLPNAVNNQTYQQTSALTPEDMAEQAKLIEKLSAENAQAKAKNALLEKDLQKIKAENAHLKPESPKPYHQAFADSRKWLELEKNYSTLKALHAEQQNQLAEVTAENNRLKKQQESGITREQNDKAAAELLHDERARNKALQEENARLKRQLAATVLDIESMDKIKLYQALEIYSNSDHSHYCNATLKNGNPCKETAKNNYRSVFDLYLCNKHKLI